MNEEIKRTYESLPEEEKEQLQKYQKKGITKVTQSVDQETGEILSTETTYSSEKKRVKGTFGISSPEEIIRLARQNKIRAINTMLPYFTDKEKYCKHIYGALFKMKCDDNQETIRKEINKYIDGIKTMITNSKKYINNNRSHFLSSSLSEHDNICSYYENIINNVEKRAEKCNIEDTLINILLEIMNHQKELKQKIKKILDSESTSNSSVSSTNNYNTNSKKNKVGLGDVLVGMAIADEVDKHIHRNDDYDEELENEMDAYALEDWQKDLVRKGEYNSWNFQEPGEDGPLEEDDYYYEDDD